jgi:hypothetical protein
MSHDVFISYSTKDKTIADAVCAKLEESKIRAWIALRDVPAGTNFAESIINAIDACKVFILIWSANTNTSEHILTELNQSFDQGITIIPFRIQDVQPTSAMRYYIGRTHWLDALTPPLENHISALKETILMNLGREAPAIEFTQIPPVPQVIHKVKDKPPARKTQSKGVPNSNKLVVGLLAAGGVVLLASVGLLLSGNIKSILPANLFQPASPSLKTSETVTSDLPEVNSEPSPTVSPTKTPTQNPTATPLPDWVKEVADPILALIAARDPDVIGDDFNSDEGWEFSPAPGAQNCDDPSDAVKEISDGTMKLSIVSCRVADLRRPVPLLTNFVLQMDVNYHNNPLGLEFRFGNRSPLEEMGSIGFNIISPSGTGNFQMDLKDYWVVTIPIAAPKHVFDPSKPVTITIITKNPHVIIYMDSTILVAYDKLESYQGPFEIDFTVNSWNTTPSEYLMLELDNVRIWDLDKPGQ